MNFLTHMDRETANKILEYKDIKNKVVISAINSEEKQIRFAKYNGRIEMKSSFAAAPDDSYILELDYTQKENIILLLRMLRHDYSMSRILNKSMRLVGKVLSRQESPKIINEMSKDKRYRYTREEENQILIIGNGNQGSIKVFKAFAEARGVSAASVYQKYKKLRASNRIPDRVFKTTPPVKPTEDKVGGPIPEPAKPKKRNGQIIEINLPDNADTDIWVGTVRITVRDGKIMIG